MTQEEIAIESEPTYIVALGRDDLADRLQRAQMTYTSALHPPLPRARPFLIGKATLQPLFDRVLGKNHLSKGRYEPGTVSALHTHNWRLALGIETAIPGRKSYDSVAVLTLPSPPVMIMYWSCGGALA